jgi:hypothetical protein
MKKFTDVNEAIKYSVKYNDAEKPVDSNRQTRRSPTQGP